MSRDRSTFTDEEIYADLASFALQGGEQGLWEWHPESGRVVLSPGTFRLFGVPSEEAPFEGWIGRAHLADQQELQQLHDRARDGLVDRVDFEMRVDAGGEWRSVRFIGGRIAAAGPPVWQGVITDTTEQRRVERALRASEERYRMLVENQGEGIGIVDPSETFLFANPAAHEIFGVPSGTLVGRSLAEFFDAEQMASIEAQTAKRRAGERSTYEVELSQPNGERRHLLVTATPHLADDGSFDSAFGVFRDVTEAKLAEQERDRLEEQLRHAQRLESVGRLAAGIAHDFNNLLAPILALSQLDLRVLNLPEAVREDLQTFRRAAERARNLTAQLLAFGRRQVLSMRAIELAEIVRETHTMLRRLIPENVELVLDLSTDPCVVRADPAQLQQVLLNLTINARDAMPGGGTVRIHTRRVQGGEEAACPRVLLEVSDDGPGMAQDVRDRIFEPFFSTKEKGEGSGLGLSMTLGIVEQHGGHIEVDSEPGRGTSFRITLPCIDEQPEQDAPRGSQATRNVVDAVVLIAEDDAGVRRSARRILEFRGVTVLEADDGEAALERAREHQGPIHVVLTDMIMPRLDGADLARQMKAVRPQSVVVFMSGYADDIVSREGVPDDDLLFVQKPFTVEALLDVIDEALMRYGGD